MKRRDLLLAAGAALATGFTPLAAQGARDPIGYIRTNWSRDPYAFGSYSYVAKGARQRDRRALEAPIEDRIFFAGEAVHPDYNSTVHAAYESGLRAADAIQDTDAERIAVIGAGMSGLAAAHALAAEGYQVTVIEARDRIGGRIWTDDRLGLPLDLGASWIHGSRGNPLTKLSDRLGLERAETGDAYVIRGQGGQSIADRDAPDWLDEVAEVQHSAGAALDEINQSAYLFQDDYDGPDVILSKGYGDIFRALSGPYEVALSSPASEIALEEAGVRVKVQGAAWQSFDAVLVTLPLGVLKKGTVTFTPALPHQKQEAIERLGMGLLDKVYLKYCTAFWDQEATWILTPENDLPPGQFNQWLNLHKYVGEPVILAFNGSHPARDLSSFSDADLIARATSTLDKAYPA